MNFCYPSWRYHRTEKPRVVNDPEEELALGDGWADTPAAFDEPENEPDSEPEGAPAPDAESAPAEKKRGGRPRKNKE